eukprot:TRINITY_DN1851_c0_g1_i13.p1 TRINITY_DN1851_c0_g1~~TRINITY_DN1851_c0_g1_i13.p1  ORF type:complete len:364 (+),score=77.22 TRINITY_DN1851_c0_g1_i13:519-1610(+)
MGPTGRCTLRCQCRRLGWRPPSSRTRCLRASACGANPMVLTRVRAADEGAVAGWLTDAHLRAAAGCGGDSIAAAIDDHRLYVADYRAFAAALRAASEATGGTDCIDMAGGADGRGAEVLLGPVAAFVLPPGGDTDGRLLPVAILPDGKPTTPALTPADGTAWTAAKAIVNAADGAHHELDTHLARTHLFVNLAMGCTSRRLSAKNHPVWRLLTPHADGTAFINNLTPHTLLSEGGDVHLLLPASRAAQVQYVGSVVTGARFNDRFPRTELASRGLLGRTPSPFRTGRMRSPCTTPSTPLSPPSSASTTSQTRMWPGTRSSPRGRPTFRRPPPGGRAWRALGNSARTGRQRRASSARSPTSSRR